MSAAPVRFCDRIFDVVGLRFMLWLGYASLLLYGALFSDPHKVTRHYDEHYFFARDDIARITVVEHHQLPAWNPYFCGGAPMAANPQDESLAPDFLLRIFFGTGPGRRLAILFFVLLGLEGTYRLARRHGASGLGSIAAGIAFGASGRFFFMIDFGWINFFGFLLLPWVILGWERAATSWKYAALGGAAIAWMLLAGGTYSVPYTVLTLVLLTVWRTFEILLGDRTRFREPWLAFIRVGLVALGLSAVKLLPMLAVIAAHPRPWDEPSIVGATGVLESLVTRHHQGGGDFAAECYVGFAVLGLAVLPLFARDKKVVPWLFFAIIFMILSAGHPAKREEPSLYGALHALPIYSQLRNPERFTLVVCLFFALAVGRGVTLIEESPLAIITRIVDRIRKREWEPGRLARALGGLGGLLLAGAATAGFAIDLLAENHIKPDLFRQDAPLVSREPFRQARGNRWDAQVWPRTARGTLLCFEENPFPQAKGLRSDRAAEEWPEDESTAKVTRQWWTPNAIGLDVDATSEARVLVNQNWDKNWRTNIGRIESADGLLALRVPPGHHTVTLRYRDPLLTLGMTVSGLTIVAFIVFGWRRRRSGSTHQSSERLHPAPTA